MSAYPQFHLCSVSAVIYAIFTIDFCEHIFSYLNYMFFVNRVDKI